jgi:hypothetical protein
MPTNTPPSTFPAQAGDRAVAAPAPSPAPTVEQLRAQVTHLGAAEARAYDAYWRDLTCDDEAAFQAWWAARQTLAAARRALAAAEECGA